MLAALIRFSIDRKAVVISLACLLMIYGCYRLVNAGLDIFPEFSPPLIIIQTEVPGYSAEQVEQLVTHPVERAISGLIGLDTVRSESIQGLSIINVFFQEQTDVYRNRQLVSERLAGISEQLPAGVGPAQALPMASSSATIMTIGVSAEAADLMQLRDVVDRSIVPRIMSVAGVADVNVFGGQIRQLQIQLDTEALKKYQLSVQQVVDTANDAIAMYGVGFVENANQRIILTLSGQPDTAEELKSMIIQQQGGSRIRLQDVADIRYAAEPPYGAASIMGQPGVIMMVIGQYGANTLTVSRAVEHVLADLENVLQPHGITFHAGLFRPANYIETSLQNIAGHLLIGGLFVILVLFLFLYDLKTALIPALAIPLSLLSAAVILIELGFNLNIMILGGLAIALGEVVDDAIIDTENIFRRLHENAAAVRPQPVARLVFDASMEVRSSVVYASFIVALVFVPLMLLGGVAGKLFSPLAFAYILAILMSLLVALTVTPALCYLLLTQETWQRTTPPVICGLQSVYKTLLIRLNRYPNVTVFVTGLLCLGIIAVLPSVGAQFLPELREGHYIVHTTSAPGTSLQESIRMGNRLTDSFLQIPGVRSVSQWAGRAERGADTYGSHYSEYEIDLKPMSGAEQEAILQQLRRILSEFPGIVFEANTFLIERVDETISGYTSPVVVNIYGDDLDYLDSKAHEIAAVMAGIPGATDIQVRSPPATPVFDIGLNPAALAFHGVPPGSVMQTIKTAYQGVAVGRVSYDNQAIDVVVILPEEQRGEPAHIAGLPVKTAAGTVVNLAQLADLKQTSGRYNILHQDGRRLQTVTCNVQGVDIDSFMQQLKRRILNQVTFRRDTYPEFTGAAIEQRQARQALILYSSLAGILVLLLIYVAIGNVRNLLLMLVNLPFSLVGGVLAVLLTGAVLSVGSLVGFVTLFGITVRNAIMLVSHYEHLLAREARQWNLDTVIQGAQERLPSILMTALVTALAMLPIAIDSDNAGREIMGPMATIIIGGLASSTLLNLLIMPIILFHYGDYTDRPGADRPGDGG